MDILQYFKERKEKLLFGIATFKENSYEALVNMIPSLMICITIISSIIALVKYIVDGTLKMQIDIVTTDGFEGVYNAFTSGTTSIFNQGIVPCILWILVLINVIIIILCFYKTEDTSKKRILTGGLIIFGVLVLIFGIMLFLSSGLFTISREVRDFYWSITLNGAPLFSIIGVVSLLLSVVLVIFSVKGSNIVWMIKDLGMAMLLSFIVMPLAIALIENIVPIVAGAIGIAIAVLVIFVMVFLGGKILFSGAGDSQTSSYNSSTTKSSTVNATVSKKTYRDSLKLEYGVKAYKVHGYQHDYIESNNGFASSEFCTLADFRKGLYRIEDSKGNALREEDIPWKN